MVLTWVLLLYFFFVENFFKSCYYLSVLKYVFDVYFWNGLFLDTMMVNTKFVEESIICSCSTKNKDLQCCVEDSKNNYMVCLLNLMLTSTDYQRLSHKCAMRTVPSTILIYIYIENYQWFEKWTKYLFLNCFASYWSALYIELLL